MNVRIIYGSNGGATADVAEDLRSRLGGEIVNVSQAGAPTLEDADLLVIGASTWGYGEIQEDMEEFLPTIAAAALTGRKVAIFGLGDQEGYDDTFVDGIGDIYDAAVKAGATVIGQVPTDGYDYSASKAERDGRFVGLPIDQNNQDDLTGERLDTWVAQLRQEIS